MAHVWRISLLALLSAGVLNLALPRRIAGGVQLSIESMGRSLLSQAARHQKAMWTLVWVVVLAPMIHLTWLVRHYAVEVPILDDWEMAPLIVKAHTGYLTFGDIFAQQEEARAVLPKLIFVLSAAQGHWDVHDQMMLSVISAWLMAVAIFVLLARSQLVAYQDLPRQEWVACAISDSFEMRPDLAKRFRRVDELWAGWTATFSRSVIPAGAQISFWAVDADEAKLYRLEDKSSVRIP